MCVILLDNDASDFEILETAEEKREIQRLKRERMQAAETGVRRYMKRAIAGEKFYPSREAQ